MIHNRALEVMTRPGRVHPEITRWLVGHVPFFPRGHGPLSAIPTLRHDCRCEMLPCEFFRRITRKLGKPQAITATAHKLARIVYHPPSTREACNRVLMRDRQTSRSNESAPHPLKSTRRFSPGAASNSAQDFWPGIRLTPAVASLSFRELVSSTRLPKITTDLLFTF